MLKSTATRHFWTATLLLGAGLASASPASPDELKSLVRRLHADPDDMALRGRIVDLAKTVTPKPQEPEEVDELKGMARERFEQARSQADFARAADAFAKVTLAAPWVGDYYLNLGLALDKAGKPEQAISNLRLYLKAEPDAPDAKKVRERIGRLSVAAEGAAAQPSRPAAPKRSDDVDISGDWMVWYEHSGLHEPMPGTKLGSIRRVGPDWRLEDAPWPFTLERSGAHIEFVGQRTGVGFTDLSVDISQEGQRMEGSSRGHNNGPPGGQPSDFSDRVVLTRVR